jgi:hypothetical protein
VLSDEKRAQCGLLQLALSGITKHQFRVLAKKWAKRFKKIRKSCLVFITTNTNVTNPTV